MPHCGPAIRVRPGIFCASTFQKSSTSVLSGVPIQRLRYRRLRQGQCRWNRHRLSRPRYIAGEPFIARLSVVGGITNYELLTRWMQLGSFLPWYRNHYDGYNKQFQEPYAYGEPVPSNCRKYVELRYRMMQVYYDAMYQWTQTGMPIARALFLNDPNDPQVYANLIQLPGMPVPCVNTEFYVGPGLSGSSDYRSTRQPQPSHPAHPQRLPPREQRLVPVRGQHRSYRRRYYRRSGAVSVTAGSIPSPSMFVPAPFCRFANWSNGWEKSPANPLTLNFYPGPDRWTDALAYPLYQDDGTTEPGNHRDTIACRGSTSRHCKTGVRSQGRYASHGRTTILRHPRRFTMWRFWASITSPTGVTRDGTALTDVGNPTGLDSSPVDAWYWNSSIQIAFAKINDNRGDTTVTFNY